MIDPINEAKVRITIEQVRPNTEVEFFNGGADVSTIEMVWSIYGDKIMADVFDAPDDLKRTIVVYYADEETYAESRAHCLELAPEFLTNRQAHCDANAIVLTHTVDYINGGVAPEA
jgi:hypothetical protein